MKSRKAQRIQMLVIGGVLLVASAAVFGFLARDAIAFFRTPSELIAESHSPDRLLRIGGLVVDGSVGRTGEVHVFEVTDGEATVSVRFAGILPDLFAEGEGVVAQGYWLGDRFEAQEVLAKHDETYMPREVADALRERGLYKGD